MGGCIPDDGSENGPSADTCPNPVGMRLTLGAQDYCGLADDLSQCGDGTVDLPFEVCDDGDLDELDGCTSTCEESPED